MKGNRTLLFAVALALLVKVGFFLWGGVTPFQGADSPSFHSLSVSVARGEGLRYTDNGAPEMVLRSFRPPLFPLFAGALFRAFGENPTVVLVAQMLLGALGLVILYALARLVFDVQVANAAALVGAVYWTSTFFENQFYSETLFAFLFLSASCAAYSAALAVEERGIARRAALSGALFGLAILCRPSALAAVPLVALWLLWVRRGEGRSAARPAAAVLVFTVLALVPWWLRNYAVHGTFLPLVSSGGLNFWAGNQVTGDPDALRAAWSIMRENPDKLTEVGLDRWFYRDAVSAILGDPLHLLDMAKQKAHLFWWPLYDNFYQLPYRLLFVFFLLGVGVSLRRPRRAAGLYLILLSQFAVAVAYASHSRYRYPIDFCVVLFAAVGLVALLRTAPAGHRWLGRALAGGILAAGALSWFFPLYTSSILRVWMVLPASAVLIYVGWRFLPVKRPE